MRFRLRALSVALGTVVAGAAVPALPAVAASGASASSAAPPVISDLDRSFVSAVGHGGAFEVAAGRHASLNAVDPTIRAIGTRMLVDHTSIGNSLRNLSVGLGLGVPDEPDREQRTVLAALTSMTGSALDCAYAMVEYFDHVATIGVFERETASGNNPQLRTFASTMLPALRDHREMIAAAVADLDCASASAAPVPTVPVVPGVPVVPTVPVVPVVPAVPTVPAVPVVPVVPADPTVPAVPVVPADPTVPGVPVVPVVPADPTVPAGQMVPADPMVPAVPVIPAPPAAP